MCNLVGKVETHPSAKDGRVAFTLMNLAGGVVLCISADGCHMPEPKKGDQVAIHGSRKRDLGKGGHSFEFLYDKLEITLP